MTINQSLRRRLETAEDKLIPRDDDNSLQRRIDDFATKYQEGKADERLDKYSEVFEKVEETPRQPAVEGVSEHQTVKKQCEEAEPLKSESRAFITPLEEFNYSEVKPGWVERIERQPDGTTIKHVSIDLTKIDPDEIDELDRPAWDWQPGPRPPSLRDVKRAMGLE